MDSATERLDSIRSRIERAHARFGAPIVPGVSRDAPPEAVTLVAVSKTFGVEAIRPFLADRR